MNESNQQRRELRSQLRSQLRQWRRDLLPRQQQQAALQLAKLMLRQPLFQRSQTMGFYIANDGELNPHALMDAALGLGKRCHLPVLRPLSNNRLWFVPYHPATPLHMNRYGIPEPRDTRKPTPIKTLDTVLMPLVGFDRHGGRLGMGGGFYDRTFSFKHRLPHSKPILIGLAHGGQEVAKLSVQKWDIPMDAVVTERGIVLCNSSAMRHFRAEDLQTPDQK